MTNHSEATGSPENDGTTGSEQHLAPWATGPNDVPDVSGVHDMHDVHEVRDVQRGHEVQAGHDKHPGLAQQADQPDCTAYEGQLAEHQVTLRTPAELADALPYLLGYRPEDSIVLVALHDRGGRGRFGGRARLGIPASTDDWDSAARQLAHGLVRGSERRGARAEQMVAFLCQEPAKGETGQQVMERLRPLAQKMRLACGGLDVPVIEALCISDGRFWSYCCDKGECCPPEGRPMGLPGTSVLAAAATYAGLQVRGTLRELQARLLPWETAAALEQEIALDTVGMALVPRILDDATRAGVAEETLELAARLLSRFAAAPPVSGTLTADLRDDELLGHDEAARLILGLQDRSTRDRAAEWMEGDEAGPALRLWRALARRCVGPYREHAAPPLTLAGWVAWSTGDDLEAREALAMALGADTDYLFARLLHQACNEGLDPESIRRCLRAERVGRERTDAGRLGRPEDAEEPVRGAAVESKPTSDAGDRRRSRHDAGSADGSRRSARGARRERATSVSRPSPPAGTHPGAPRPGSTAARTSKRTAARTLKRTAPSTSSSTAPRTSKKGTARRSGPRPDGARPGNAGAEGDA
ncbi:MULTISPECIES: DUF4192 domain-containing protein [unclassified Streptomyces]|uniref:DUF4192 domain-containing protein n=1 Tax=unclassified Streptomyces TaxID=2593676 RepID=UPI002365F877|nr:MULTISPECIES: DUF4192 domain-containing protein [unclassified Streptomyces]MDF3147182.1 DUF4192 domain-containing protein [Streptomyces sp. T21Q-yed]WDF41835.1 DUF4192 domain-containing protein [Streptomyces sp. T12]